MRVAGVRRSSGTNRLRGPCRGGCGRGLRDYGRGNGTGTQSGAGVVAESRSCRTQSCDGGQRRTPASRPATPGRGDAPGDHGIQGLADGFIPALVNLDEIDQIVRVATQDAIDAARQIGSEEGLLVGISSGANVLAAEQVAQGLGPGRNVVTMLCDRGERYLSIAGRVPH